MKARTPYICALVAIAVFATGTPEATAAILGQIDTFETGGNTEGWAGGDGFNVPSPIPAAQVGTGGPNGAADGYLQIGTLSYHLGTRNAVQWTGDYLAAGITSIEMDVNHLNPGFNTVELRVLIDGPGGLFASTNLAPSLIGDTWEQLSFGLTAADLTYVSGGTNDLASTLSAVSRLQVRHDRPVATLPGFHPPHITATVGIDNIQAVPEPATITLLVAALAVVIVRRRRK